MLKTIIVFIVFICIIHAQVSAQAHISWHHDDLCRTHGHLPEKIGSQHYIPKDLKDGTREVILLYRIPDQNTNFIEFDDYGPNFQ